MSDLPWTAIQAKYPIGHKVKGAIKRVWQFGTRVELEPGVTGLIRNKELNWDQPVNDATTYIHQEQPLTVGRRVVVSVLRNEQHGEDLLLSLRRAIYDPWEHQNGRFRGGRSVRGTVALVAKSYALVNLTDFQNNACLTARLPKEEVSTLENRFDRNHSRAR